MTRKIEGDKSAWLKGIRTVFSSFAQPSVDFGVRLQFCVRSLKSANLIELAEAVLKVLDSPMPAWIEATIEAADTSSLTVGLDTAIPGNLPALEYFFEQAPTEIDPLPDDLPAQLHLVSHEGPITRKVFESGLLRAILNLVRGGKGIRRIVVYSNSDRPHGVSLGMGCWFALPALKVSPRLADQKFTLGGETLDFGVADFWRWGCSDLVGNVWRGVLAEFIVGTALDCAPDGPPRVEWDACDFCTSDGIWVEVKSSAYLQSWAQEGLSEIAFSIKPTQGWDAETNVFAKEKSRQADVYVFCLLAHRNKATVDPLNLDHWRFYILPTIRLRDRPSSESISLVALERLTEGVSYSNLRTAVQTAADPRNLELMHDFMRMRSATEMEVACVIWEGQQPSLQWKIYRVWPTPPSSREQAAARRRALADRRYFLVCRECGLRCNRGHMLEAQLCLSCAHLQHGVVY